MQRRLRKEFTSLRGHTSASYAKALAAGDFSGLHIILVKATSPDDLPLPDKCVHDLLKIFSTSPSSYRAFSLSFTRRFSNTQCWRVALKCLVLLHRLLRSLPDNTSFMDELRWARSTGLISLYPCHFRDLSSSDCKNYTVFIRSYAQLLDEALNYLYTDSNKEVKEERSTGKTNKLNLTLEILPQIQSLIDRVMDCRPTGAAARSFLVQNAMKYIIRDSFVCYTTFRKEIVVVLDQLIQMPYRSGIEAFGIYKKAATQGSHLSEFYYWSKSMGICGIYEYPYIDRIPHIQIRALETFLDKMWESTEPSPSTTSLMTSESRASSSEENYGSNWAKFKEIDTVPKNTKKEVREPPIQLDDDPNNIAWEVLLEDSVSFSPTSSKNYLLFDNRFQI
ncbi:hypothetical protein LguiB_014963 [Lonicera macranthoides]